MDNLNELIAKLDDALCDNYDEGYLYRNDSERNETCKAIIKRLEEYGYKIDKI